MYCVYYDGYSCEAKLMMEEELPLRQYFFIVVFVLGGLFLYFLTRNDYDEKKNLSKKGFIKLFSGMGIIFIVIVLFVVFTSR